jgi:hypothetical protein
LEYLDPVRGRDDGCETAAIRLLIGSGTVTDVIYAGTSERLSITLDNGVDPDNHYDNAHAAEAACSDHEECERPRVQVHSRR